MKYKTANETIAVDVDKVETKRDFDDDRLNQHDHGLDFENVDEERTAKRKELEQADNEKFIEDAFNTSQKKEGKFPSVDPWTGEPLDPKTGKPLKDKKQEKA